MHMVIEGTVPLIPLTRKLGTLMFQFLEVLPTRAQKNDNLLYPDSLTMGVLVSTLSIIGR